MVSTYMHNELILRGNLHAPYHIINISNVTTILIYNLQINRQLKKEKEKEKAQLSRLLRPVHITQQRLLATKLPCLHLSMRT